MGRVMRAWREVTGTYTERLWGEVVARESSRCGRYLFVRGDADGGEFTSRAAVLERIAQLQAAADWLWPPAEEGEPHE